MSRSLVFPSPKECFDVDPKLLQQLGELSAEEQLGIDLTNPNGDIEQEVCDLARPLLRDGSRAIGRKVTDLLIRSSIVEPGKTQFDTGWHTDLGLFNTVAVADNLPIEFAVGMASDTSGLREAHRNRFDIGFNASLRSPFSLAVDEAIKSGELELVRAPKLKGMRFTNRHVHRPGLNSGLLPIRRTSVLMGAPR